MTIYDTYWQLSEAIWAQGREPRLVVFSSIGHRKAIREDYDNRFGYAPPTTYCGHPFHVDHNPTAPEVYVTDKSLEQYKEGILGRA